MGAPCPMCGKKTGLLRKRDAATGLCEYCLPQAQTDVAPRAKRIMSSSAIMDRSTSLNTVLSRCDLCLDDLTYIRDTYESRGIPIIQPSTDELMRTIAGGRDEAVTTAAEAIAAKASAKEEAAATAKSRATALRSGASSLAELRVKLERSPLGCPQVVMDLQQDLQFRSQRAELNGHLEAARKAEAMGEAKKALRAYQEAVFFLRNDQVDDALQREEIDGLNAKIAELGGNPI